MSQLLAVCYSLIHLNREETCIALEPFCFTHVSGMNCWPFYLFFFGGFEDVRSETHVVQKTGQKKRTLGNKEAGGQENVKKNYLLLRRSFGVLVLHFR